MKYTLTILESDHATLTNHLFSREDEQAAFLLCRQATTAEETRLLVRTVIPVADDDIESASSRHMSIRSSAYVPLLKRADDGRDSIVFVHSHPKGHPDFSGQDDVEETALFKTAYTRIRHAGVHGSLVFTAPQVLQGRVWLESGEHAPIDRVRIVGSRFRFLDRERPLVAEIEAYDRQARAFGRDLQPLLKSLHVGVVGQGGTGSAVFEQLVRLGFGKITSIDPQNFEASNVSRVYGSRFTDHGIPKVHIAKRSADTIGLGTIIVPIVGDVSYRSVAEELRACDVVFGCTDDEWGRSILTALAVYYGIPVFDMGVAIDTEPGTGAIRSIVGRSTLLMPGTACLFCRNRITSRRVSEEAIRATSPERIEGLEHEGYISGVREPAPAVIAFTSGTAALAVAELLNRLVGYKGADDDATELLYFFDQTRIRGNATPPGDNCFCSTKTSWMRGDEPRFLNLTWRPE